MCSNGGLKCTNSKELFSTKTVFVILIMPMFFLDIFFRHLNKEAYYCPKYILIEVETSNIR